MTEIDANIMNSQKMYYPARITYWWYWIESTWTAAMIPVKMTMKVPVAVISYGCKSIYNQLAVRMTPPPNPRNEPIKPAMKALNAFLFINCISYSSRLCSLIRVD